MKWVPNKKILTTEHADNTQYQKIQKQHDVCEDSFTAQRTKCITDLLMKENTGRTPILENTIANQRLQAQFSRMDKMKCIPSSNNDIRRCM